MTRRWLPIVVVAALLGAVAQWLPVGRTTSAPEPPAASSVPDIAAAPPTTAPAPTTTDATFPPPHPPVVLETPAGELEWTASDPIEVPAEGGSLVGFAARGDGTPVLAVGTDAGMFAVEPGDGTARAVQAAELLRAPVAGMWRVGGDLVVTGWGERVPLVWWEEVPGSWQALPVAEPPAPAPWLMPTWESPPVVVDTGTEIELFSSYRSFRIDWAALVGEPADGFWLHQPDGDLVVFREGRQEVRYRASLTATGDTLTVRVADPLSGDVLAEESTQVEGAAEIVAAAVDEHVDLSSTEATPARWRFGLQDGFSLVDGGFTDGSGLPFHGDIVHSELGYLAVRSRFAPADLGSLGVWHSPDGIGWEEIGDRIGVDGAQVVAIAARPGMVAIVVRAIETYELSEGVTARGQVDRVAVSSDLRSWLVEPIGNQGRTTVTELAAGPLGFVAVGGDDCNPTCARRVWVSTDGVSWPSVDLPTESVPDDTPVVVTSDAVYVPEFLDFRDLQVRVWTGRLAP